MRTLLILLTFFPLISFGIVTNTNILYEYSPEPVTFTNSFELSYIFPAGETPLNINANIDFASCSVVVLSSSIMENRATVQLLPYEISNFIIPPLEVSTINYNKTNTFLTPPAFIRTHPIEISYSNLKMQDIVDIYEFQDWTILIIILVSFAVIALIIFLIIFILKKLKKKKNEVTPEVVIDPYEEIEDELTKLKEIPMDEHNYKDIFVKTSEIIRRFIERTYDINALEFSSSEIKAFFKYYITDNELDKELTEIIEHILRMCDRVKYAKHKPDYSQKNVLIDECYSFVEYTKTRFHPAATDINNTPEEETK